MMKEYDLIVSLGGNCAAACQLRMRGKRPFSLPFDWLCMENPETIEWLAHAFKTDFSDFCLKKNLVPIEKGELPEGGTTQYRYVDVVSGYRFIHHFHKPIEGGDGYETVYSMLSRRLRRMDRLLRAANDVLFILATNFTYELSLIEILADAIKAKYACPNLDFIAMQFGAQFTDGRLAEEGSTDFCRWGRYKRRLGGYDLSLTSAEWAFMDDVALKGFPLRPIKGLDKVRYKLWKHLSKHFLNTGAGLKDLNLRG